MTFKAEYIWIDGTEPTAKLRSKTKILADDAKGAELPIWGFDGSSTNQAEGHASDRVLKPVSTCPDPIRGGDDVLVMCEVLNIDMTPHESNTRAALTEVAEKFAAQEPIFGIEQEYTFFEGSRPLGFPEGGFPAAQGGYYCGVGADEIFGRDIVEAHLENCLKAGLAISGINAEVMPGQWEFQVGPVSPLEVSDQLWVARWLLYRTAEDFDVSATLDPKPVKGDWNGAGAHTNFSTKAMREGYDAIITACESLGEGSKPLDHVKNYGAGIDDRLTGLHETAPWNEYSLRRLQPWRLGPYPVAGREGRQGLHRGPPPERERRPVRRDAADRRHLLHGAGEGRPGLTTRTTRLRTNAAPYQRSFVRLREGASITNGGRPLTVVRLICFNGPMASPQKHTATGRHDLEPFWPSRQHHDFDRVCCRAMNAPAL